MTEPEWPGIPNLVPMRDEGPTLQHPRHFQPGRLDRVWIEVEDDRHDPPVRLIRIDFESDLVPGMAGRSVQGFSCRATLEALDSLLRMFWGYSLIGPHAGHRTLYGVLEAIRESAPVGAGPPILGFRCPVSRKAWMPGRLAPRGPRDVYLVQRGFLLEGGSVHSVWATLDDALGAVEGLTCDESCGWEPHETSGHWRCWKDSKNRIVFVSKESLLGDPCHDWGPDEEALVDSGPEYEPGHYFFSTCRACGQRTDESYDYVCPNPGEQAEREANPLRSIHLLRDGIQLSINHGPCHPSTVERCRHCGLEWLCPDCGGSADRPEAG